MEHIKKVKIIAILAFMIACLSLGIGYSSLNATMEINGTANVVEKEWKVTLSNVHAINFSDDITLVSKEPTLIDDKVNLGVTFNQLSAMISFYIDVVNSGGFDAEIESFGFNGLDSVVNNITYSVEGLKQGDKILATESLKDVKVTLTYSSPLIGMDGLNQPLVLNDVNFFVNIKKIS